MSVSITHSARIHKDSSSSNTVGAANATASSTPATTCSLDEILQQFDASILEPMLVQEQHHHPYLYYFFYQPHITCAMRRVLVDWLNEVSEAYSLERTVFQASVNLVDRFLTLTPAMIKPNNADAVLLKRAENESVISRIVDSKNMQLIGITCLWIASKFNWDEPSPSVNDFVYCTNGAFTVQQLNDMERLVFQVLDWKVDVVTPYDFFNTFVATTVKLMYQDVADKLKSGLSLPDLTKKQTQCFHNFTILMSPLLSQYAMAGIDCFLIQEQSLRFYPSAIAAAALYTVFAHHPHVYSYFERATTYKHDDLLPCIQLLQPIYARITLRDKPDAQQLKQYPALKLTIDRYHTRAMHYKEFLPILDSLESQFHTVSIQCHTNLKHSLPSFFPEQAYRDLTASGLYAPIYSQHTYHQTEWKVKYAPPPVSFRSASSSSSSSSCASLRVPHHLQSTSLAESTSSSSAAASPIQDEDVHMMPAQTALLPTAITA